MSVRVSSLRWKTPYKFQKLIFRNKYYFLVIFIFLYTSLKLYFKETLQSNSSKDDKFQQHRNISFFFNSTAHTKYQESCNANTEVIISVISAPSNTEARKAIRKSWSRYLPLNWELLFFVGKSKTINVNALKVEKEYFKDVILLDFEDSYDNLTIKVYYMLHWVNQQCQQPKFLIKTDDDVYLSPQNIKKLLNCSLLAIENTYKPNILLECNQQWNMSKLLGHFIDKETRKYISYIVAGYLYQRVHADRDPSSKWYLSSATYKPTLLPEFLSGTSYFMSTNLIPHVLEAALKTPIINLEDVYYTGLIMRESLNLKLSHIDGWSNFRPRWDDICLYKKLFSVHGLSPQEVIGITDDIANNDDNCTYTMNLLSSINKFVSYYFPRYKF